MTTFAVLGVVWALLLLLVRGASVTLTRQTDKLRARSRQLMESYARLEESSLEAIETLNATVEAKDPYTAGHSQRVQDGTGYPDCLAGADIPLEAAVVGLADVWDAMTTDRPYRRALSIQEALEEVRAGRGTQFAPEVVDAFLATLGRWTVHLVAKAGGRPLQAAG